MQHTPATHADLCWTPNTTDRDSTPPTVRDDAPPEPGSCRTNLRNSRASQSLAEAGPMTSGGGRIAPRVKAVTAADGPHIGRGGLDCGKDYLTHFNVHDTHR
jgi:hypothetical protein